MCQMRYAKHHHRVGQCPLDLRIRWRGRVHSALREPMLLLHWQHQVAGSSLASHSSDWFVPARVPPPSEWLVHRGNQLDELQRNGGPCLEKEFECLCKTKKSRLQGHLGVILSARTHRAGLTCFAHSRLTLQGQNSSPTKPECRLAMPRRVQSLPRIVGKHLNTIKHEHRTPNARFVTISQSAANRIAANTPTFQASRA